MAPIIGLGPPGSASPEAAPNTAACASAAMSMPVPCAPSPTACSPCSAPCSGPRRSTTRTAMPNPPPHNNRGGQSPQKTTCKQVGSPARAPCGRLAGMTIGVRRPSLGRADGLRHVGREEEHTPEHPSLMRTSYAVFFLKKKIKNDHNEISRQYGEQRDQ